MKKYFLLIVNIIISITFSNAQELNDFEPAPIKHGILENGMHYYIMHNDQPKDRVAFYFAQNVGSIQEEDNQRGLAHFLEHMAFNGTEHYKDKRMLEFLEKNGVKFGEEINAFTLYDETVYSIRNVPVKNEKFLDSVLLILKDWSGGLTLSDKEIDDERGVVKEEWRSRYHPRKIASDSINNQGLLKGSKYSRRSPIGIMEVIDNFNYEDLRNYYNRWYRPDLQAVIIVGNIDETKMEEKVKSLFSGISLKKNLPKRENFDIPLGDDFTYLNITNKELGAPTITYYIKHKIDNTLNEKEYTENRLRLSMLSSILDRRLSKIAALNESSVFSARFAFEDIARSMGAFKISLQPKRDSLKPALKFAATELKRFMMYGATPEEFERTKSSMITNFKNSLKKDGYSNVYNAIEIYKAFFRNHEFVDYKWANQYQLDYLKDFKNEDLIQFFKEYYSTKANVVTILGSDNVEYPLEDEILNTLKEGRASNPEPYKETIIAEKKLKDLDLLGSEIISEEEIKNKKGIKYTLSNGAKVWLYNSQPTKDDNIYFKAFSLGGRSLLNEDFLPNSLFATTFAEASGIANLSKLELRKSNEVIVPTVRIEDYEETLESYVNLNSFENLLKGIYLVFTEPRFDDKIFDVTKQQLENLEVALNSSIQSELSDSLQMALSNYSNREVHLSKELLDKLSMEKMETIYRDRIANASDFDFIFMGNIETKKFIELVKKYIGSISSNNSFEHAVNHNMKPKVGINKVHLLRKMETPQSTVKMYFTGNMEYNNKNILLINIIEQLLKKRYMDRIREEEGGTYGVRVQGDLKRIPEDSFFLNISFNCNPDKTNKLVEIVYEELENLIYKINKAELIEIKSSLKKEVEEKRANNTYYFGKAINSFKNNVPFSSEEEVLKRINSITDEDIKSLAKQITKNPRVVEGVLNPIIE